MYQNIYCQFNKNSKYSTIHLWDDKVGYQKLTYKRYAYIKDPSGTYRSLYGDKLKRVTFWTKEDLEKNKVFESDIPLDTKFLIDKYGTTNEISTNHKIMCIDIEVDSSSGFPSPEKTTSEIISIAFYDSTDEQYYALVLSDKIKSNKYDNVTVLGFDSEIELLQAFFRKYLKISPTIITGWHVDGFDIPYLFNRTTIVLGHDIATLLSPINIVTYNKNKKKYKIAGVSVLDYLALYKNFTFKQQPSYRLDYIGQIEIESKKVEYDGSLNDLYLNDIEKFVRYNLQDVKIVVDLDKKLDLITLVRGIAHLGHISYEDVFYSSRYIEGAMLVYMKELNVIAPNKIFYAINERRNQYAGAYVKTPQVGKHNWVFDLDVTSMYPSIIISLNISPETKVGKIIDWDVKAALKGVDKNYTFIDKDGHTDKLTSSEVSDILANNKISIATNGVLYKSDKKGLIPAILEKWIDERKEFKNLFDSYRRGGDLEKADYFYRRQHIQKILLNTVYGVFGLPIFRFYDIDNSEATTLTGQELIKFSQKTINYKYNKELNTEKDYVAYIDTDSCFSSSMPLIKHRYPTADFNDDDFMIKQTLNVASEIQDFLNESYNYFAERFLNIKDGHRFYIKQEVISKRVLFVTKKRYGQWIINDGGQPCNKIDIKGLDIIKSSFSPAFQKLMFNVLQGILSDTDKSEINKIILKFKKEMKTFSVSELATPTGVKGIEKFIYREKNGIFTRLKKGAPIHVKSAVRYNDLLKTFKLQNKYELIKSHDKIKWVYLRQNPYGINSIAIKGYGNPDQILSFIEEYIDYNKIFKQGLQKKIKMFYDALKWSDPVDSQTSLERFF